MDEGRPVESLKDKLLNDPEVTFKEVNNWSMLLEAWYVA